MMEKFRGIWVRKINGRILKNSLWKIKNKYIIRILIWALIDLCCLRIVEMFNGIDQPKILKLSNKNSKYN